MPCYEVNLISVDLKAADHDTLIAALKSLGLKFTDSKNFLSIQTPQGVIRVSDGIAKCDARCQSYVNKIKQAYSLKTVERISKRYKFTMTNRENNKITLRRY